MTTYTVLSGSTLNGIVLDLSDYMDVLAGGLATGTTINTGGEQVVETGGATDSTTISGGYDYVYGSATTTSINGGLQIVFGTATNTTVNSGDQWVEAGGAASFTTINGDQKVDDGATATYTTIMNGGNQGVWGTASYTYINSGGEQVITAGLATNTTISSGGIQYDYRAATNTSLNGGEQFVEFGSATGTTIDGGGLQFATDGVLIGTTIINGTESVTSGATAQDVTFGGRSGTLDLVTPSGLTGVLSDWQVGDVIDFVNTSITGANISGSTLSITESGGQTFSYQLAGQEADTQTSLQSDGSGGTDLTLSYVPPTVAVSISSGVVNLAADTATVTFTFSQAPTDFSLSDATATGGALSDLNGSGTIYTATFSASANTDISNASVSVAPGSYHDSLGAAGLGGGTGDFVVDTVTPTVPTADGDAVVGKTVTVDAAHGVLAGASDPAPSQPLVVTEVNGESASVGNAIATAFGTLTLNADGSYSYTPGASSSPDIDNVSFTVADQYGNSTTATLSILVSPSKMTLYVGTAGGSLNVGNGASVIDARAGNETIKAGNGKDFIFAGQSDNITAGNGQDSVVAGAGGAITLGNGNDTVSGGPGSTIIAGNGNDTVSLGAGGANPTPTLTTLTSFNGTDGSSPGAGSGLIADAAGDLFGTTSFGGAHIDGTVFEIAKTGGVYASSPIVLYSASEQYPGGALIADAAGNLFGTTNGVYGDSTVFELVNNGSGDYMPVTLASFSFGTTLTGKLTADAAGDLFGTTMGGGAGGYGTVFELVNNGGGRYTPTTLASFTGDDGALPGASPYAGVIADAAGDLFGTTILGGASGDGTVFELVNNGGGNYTPTTLVSFSGANGYEPRGGLIEDASGDLFGTTTAGGANGDGTVFEIAKTGAGYASTPTILESFDIATGVGPYAGLLADAAGDLFGTTAGGGAGGYGTVFELVNDGAGSYTPTTLVSFDGANGIGPFAGLFADAAGDLFGTTSAGGANGLNDGTVFELSGAGFQAGGTISLGDGNDTITGGGGVTISAGNGNDSVTAGVGGKITLGDGKDTVSAGTGSTIALGKGNDTVTGGDGIAITAGNGNDSVTVGAGGKITLGDGKDTVSAGTGSTIALGKGNDTVTGGDGIAITAGDGSDSVTVGAGGKITLGDGKDNVSAGTGSTIALGNGKDTVTGGDAVAITAGGGNDSVTAGAGSTITLGNGNDTVSLGAGGASPTPALTTLTSFDGTDGSSPAAGFIADAAGDLFGTTYYGGTNGDGTVFEIAKTSTGYASAPTVLENFDGAIGIYPEAALIADAAGDLFGTTELGGVNGDGTVFELMNKGAGNYTPTKLVSFDGNNGQGPAAGLIADAAGDLFGTTTIGGAIGYGAVFEIAKTNTGYASAPTVLENFDITNGAYPQGTLIADAAGDLFGTTREGGVYGDGTVFELANKGGGNYTPTPLASFNGDNGSAPLAGLIADAAGDLFGTTPDGGLYGDGVVFELMNKGGGSYTLTPLAGFDGNNGQGPAAGLIADAAGNLFGTTPGGGATGDGTVFEIARTGGGYASTPTVLANGVNSFAGLIADAAGNLFGTTSAGGPGNDGTVFELSGSGFEAGGTISLGGGNDTVTGGDGVTITAGDGNDSVTDGDGGKITLGNGKDKVTAGANSAIQAGDGNDAVTAGTNSTIALGNGNDSVTAGSNDAITVGNGQNHLLAASGDIWTVGNGKDLFTFDPGFGNNVITDFDISRDVLQFDHSLFANFAGVMAHTEQLGANTVIAYDANDTITLYGVTAAHLTARDFKFI